MPPRKKAKLSDKSKKNASHYVALSNSRSGKGSLEIVRELPLDISLQIFGHLHPKDLLNLARTSKAFRSFFLNRSNSISIWKSALRNVKDLPKKPAFLSEPAFAHLLFNPFCQRCGSAGVQNPLWEWFARYCAACFGSVSYGRSLTGKFAQDLSLKELVYRRSHELFNVYRRHHIHDLQLERFAVKWKNCRGDEERQKTLIEKQRNATKEQATLAEQFGVWHTAMQKHRSAELEGMRQQRLQDILDRLSQEDSEWLPEMEHFGDDVVGYRIVDIPAVRQTNRLTDRAWPKVLEALTEEMEMLRELRFEEEREELIKERLHELEKVILNHYVHLPKTASMDCRPNARILLGEKACLDLVVAPSGREVTSRDFARVVPISCSRWETLCSKELRLLVRATIPDIPTDVDPLHLAVAVFDCLGRCSGRVAHRYPSLLAHTCLCSRPRTDSQQEEELEIDRVTKQLFSRKGSETYKPLSPRVKVRHCGSLARGLQSVVRMKHIVSALGLDPTRAKHEEISDAWLRCRVCSPTSRKVFGWEAALFHFHSTRSTGYNYDSWEKVSEDDMAIIRQLQEAGNKPSKDKTKVRWGCTLCQDWDSIGPEVESHLKEEHQMEDWDKCIEDGTLYLHYNQPFGSTHSFVLPSP